MAEINSLIPDTNIDEAVDSVEVLELTFNNPEGQKVRYNRLAVNLTNGEQLLFKLEGENKAVARFTVRGLAK